MCISNSYATMKLMLYVALLMWMITASYLTLQDMGESSDIKSQHKCDDCEYFLSVLREEIFFATNALNFMGFFIGVIVIVVCNTICVKSYYIQINWAGWFDIMVLVVNQFASTPNTEILTICCSISSSLPSAAYMRQWIWSALVQIMAWCLLGAKSLSKTGLSYFQLDPK